MPAKPAAARKSAAKSKPAAKSKSAAKARTSAKAPAAKGATKRTAAARAAKGSAAVKGVAKRSAPAKPAAKAAPRAAGKGKPAAVPTPRLLRDALPNFKRRVTDRSLKGEVTIWRDPEGVAHVKAENERDAYFGQGFVAAQDRLWQMEYDRRRAAGRWAEVVGPEALAGDKQMARFQIARYVPEMYRNLQPETRAMCVAYAAGVNAFLKGGDPLPAECTLTGIKPAPWKPEDSLTVFLVRHILMGQWESKLWRARLLLTLGPEKMAALHPGYEQGQLVMVPPGGRYHGQVLNALDEFAEGLKHLTFLKHLVDDGSNNWVIGGERTASGKPLLAGDPHRALDVPNVYYQNHVACPEWDTIGFSFPGVPGFPHFAHNAHVAWAITHASADYQDLYIEQFEGGRALRTRFKRGTQPVEHQTQTLRVRGGKPVTLDLYHTHHGPVVAGDPKSGTAIAFRYSALHLPNTTMDAIYQMQRARNADEIEGAMRSWVDPGNNMVYCDQQGNFGYRTRGTFPVRSEATRWLPVPGWTGAHEWKGTIPFEEMPATRNPACGFAYTANNRIPDEHYPHYIGMDFAPGWRAERIYSHLAQGGGFTAGRMAEIHGERVSEPARAFQPLLARLKPNPPELRAARDLLLAWDGNTTRDSSAAPLWAAFRRALLVSVLEPLLGGQTRRLLGAHDRGANAVISRTMARLHLLIASNDATLRPAGRSWDGLMEAALGTAWAECVRSLGDDPGAWRWDSIHHTAAAHLLSGMFPQQRSLLDPPVIHMGGDGDTPHAAAYYLDGDYRVRSQSVARYIFDVADWNASRWVIPAGVSGHPGSPHYADQIPAYEAHHYHPMRWDWAEIARTANARQTLRRG